MTPDVLSRFRALEFAPRAALVTATEVAAAGDNPKALINSVCSDESDPVTRMPLQAASQLKFHQSRCHEGG